MQTALTAEPPSGPSLTYAGVRRRLERGVAVTIGRGTTCDLRLPADPFLSRLAASVTAVDDYLLVRNLSSTQSLALRPPVGEDRAIEPLAAGTSLPFRVFQIVFVGQAGIEVHVDARAAAEPVNVPASGMLVPHVGDATVTRPLRLTNTQRRVLGALCAPLLTRRGPAAAPATYQQIGEALNLRPQYVRKVIQELRDALTGYGVPGLSSEEQASAEDFRWPLARLAIRSGWIHELPDA